MALFNVVIPGRPIVKKNTQRTVGYGRKKRVIYSPNFLAWQRIAMLLCLSKKPRNPIGTLITAEFKFYFKNRQAEADTSNLIEGAQDVLTKSEVIRDDRLICKVIAEKIFGETPRVEISLFNYEKSTN